MIYMDCLVLNKLEYNCMHLPFNDFFVNIFLDIITVLSHNPLFANKYT